MPMEIEFEINPRSGHINIPVRVNGEGPFRFTLDTGAVATTLSIALTEKLDIEINEDPEGKYSAMGLEYHLANLDEFEVGHLRRKNEEVIVFDMHAILGSDPKSMWGNIGHSTLKDYILSINYQKRTLRLEESNTRVEMKESWIPFEYVEDTHLISLKVKINEKGPYDLALDTGSPIVALTPGLAKEIDLKLSESGPMVKGIGGMTQGYFTDLEQISVGDANQMSTNALVIDLSAVTRRGKNLPNGILGASFLNKYEVVIDYPNMRLALLSPTID